MAFRKSWKSLIGLVIGAPWETLHMLCVGPGREVRERAVGHGVRRLLAGRLGHGGPPLVGEGCVFPPGWMSFYALMRMGRTWGPAGPVSAGLA